MNVEPSLKNASTSLGFQAVLIPNIKLRNDSTENLDHFQQPFLKITDNQRLALTCMADSNGILPHQAIWLFKSKRLALGVVDGIPLMLPLKAETPISVKILEYPDMDSAYLPAARFLQANAR